MSVYSYEDRIRAVQLYIKYDRSIADTIRELGYPDRKTLTKWYKEYVENGDLHIVYSREPRFTNEQKQKAVDYYHEHGRYIRRTVRILGYPSRGVWWPNQVQKNVRAPKSGFSNGH